MLHPVIALALSRTVRRDQLAAADRRRLIAGGRSGENAFEPRLEREVEIVRFGRRYLREAGDRIAA